MYSQNEVKDKLDWMYKGANGLVDREEYLLGRKIDKTLEQINEEEKQKELGIVYPKNHVEHECIPPSIRDYKLQVGDQVDLATKLQEDPLVAIKKREEETRRQFLQNPIQLKKLQTALTKRARKIKKKDRHRKAKGDSDIDTKIAEKLKLLKNGLLDVDLVNAQVDDNEVTDKLDAILLRKFNKLKDKLSDKDLQQILEWKESNSSEDSDGSDWNSARKRRLNVRTVKSKVSGDSSESDDKNWGSRNSGNDISVAKSSRHRSFNQPKNNVKDLSKSTDSKKRKLTQKEKEKLRQEMMVNASWREKERVSNIKRYKEEDKKESQQSGKYNTEFIHKELLKSANNSSVESRIKSNINSIQRSGGDMNKNFSRRH